MNSKQKKHKKVVSLFTTLFSLVIALSFFVFLARAQEQVPNAQPVPGIAVATVNIQNPVIEGQAGNNLNIAFDISNRQIAQSGVRYAVQLIRTANGQSTGEVADEKVYPENLSLSQDTTLHKEIAYQVPGFINGDFEVWVISKNDKGMFLAFGKAGTIKLNGSSEFVEIMTATCFLSVAGDGDKYAPEQGVDISKTETLQASCEVRNGIKTDISVVPQFELRYRSSFGETISIQKQPAVNFISLEQKPLSLVIPKPDKSQAYDAVLTLLNNKGQIISNSANFHFVLRGGSATIQNVTLDRTSYQKGETAKINFMFTPSADSFPGARGEGTNMGSVILKLDIMDKNGALCGSSEEKFAIAEPAKTQLNVPISDNCVGAVITAVLTDKDGNVLDSVNPKIQARLKQPTSPEPAKKSRFGPYIIFSLLVLALLVAGLIIWKKRKNKNIVIGPMLLFFAANAFFFARGASADTFCGPINNSMHACCMSECTTVNIDKSEYRVNDPITATANANYWRICNNTSFSPVTVNATINKQTKTIIPLTGGGTNIIRSEIFTAESVSGSYNARFYIAYQFRMFGGYGGSSTYIDIPYDVLAGPFALDLQATPHCSPDGIATFNWRYGDPDKKPQTKFRIQVSSSSNLSSPVIDTGEVSSATSAYVSPAGKLKLDNKYYWRLMVWNSDGIDSGWISGPSFTLSSSYASGALNFTWVPQNPKSSEQVYFTPDLSAYNYGRPVYNYDENGQPYPAYDEYGRPILSYDGWQWNWTFQNGTPRSSKEYSPTIIFNLAGQNSVNFKAIDPDGNSCGVQKNVNVQTPVMPGQCKTPPNNQEYCAPAKPPTAANELCSAYDTSRPPTLSGSGPWSWTCYGSGGGSNASCSAYQRTPVTPQCGSPNFCAGTDVDTPCASGTASSYSDQNAYEVNWKCTGSCPSTSIDCSARGTKACGWIETSP